MSRTDYTAVPLKVQPDTTGQTGASHRSNWSARVPHVDTGQTSPSNWSDRSQQNRGAAHSGPKGATRQNSSLGVSLHHFPPPCISADKFNTVGAEIHVRVSWNKLDSNKPWATNTQQDLPDQWL